MSLEKLPNKTGFTLEPHAIRSITVLVKKELASYFNSPIAYILICAFACFANWLFFKPFFLVGEATLRDFFLFLPWLILALIPAITMRLWSEEKRSGTIELILTMPISDWQAVLAKYFSALIFVVIILLATINIPITVSQLGKLDLGVVWAGYLGLFFLSAVFLAIGQFASSLTKNQIISFVVSLIICFLLYIASASFILTGLPTIAAKILLQLGLASRFTNAAKGVIDTRDIIYHLSLVFLFLWLNVRVLSNRKWK